MTVPAVVALVEGNSTGGDRRLNKLALYGTDDRLFASDVCAKFKVT